MIEYLNEDDYLEDIYGDEIKVGDEYYINDDGDLIHENNLMLYLKENHTLKRMER